MNISTGGLRISNLGDDLERDLGLGDRLVVALALEPRLRIEAQGAVRWVANHNAGLEFDPPLAGAALNDLARWVFQRREEDRQQAPPRVRTLETAPPKGPGSLLLVSGSAELEAQLGDALSDLGPLVRVGGFDLGTDLAGNPALVLLHAQRSDLDDQARLQALAQLVDRRFPTLLLATDLEPAQLYRLARDLNLPHCCGFRPSDGPFFNRMVGGLIRQPDRVQP